MTTEGGVMNVDVQQIDLTGRFGSGPRIQVNGMWISLNWLIVNAAIGAMSLPPKTLNHYATESHLDNLKWWQNPNHVLTPTGLTGTITGRAQQPGRVWVQLDGHSNVVSFAEDELRPSGEKIDRNDGELIALIHSEVSEALEGVRKNLPDDKLPHRPMVEVELADALIRIFDYAGARGLDLEGAYQEKRVYNASRTDHTHEARRAEGGKAF